MLYEIHTELINSEFSGKYIEESAYTPEGFYIGTPNIAYLLCQILEITPTPFPDSGRDVCCIGFSEKTQKWYGWSHVWLRKPFQKLICYSLFVIRNTRPISHIFWNFLLNHGYRLAIYGFGIGDKITYKKHCCTHSYWTDEYLQKYPEKDARLPVGFEAKTLDDAKRMAMATI